MANEVNYLYEPEGSELHWDGLQKKPDAQERAGLVHPANRPGMQGTSAAQAEAYAAPPPAPAPAPARRPPTYEELKAMADRMVETQAVQHQALLAADAATGNRDAAGNKIPDWLTNEMRKQGK